MRFFITRRSSSTRHVPNTPYPTTWRRVLDERQNARMPEIKNLAQTWMALNTFKCNCLTPLHVKGLNDFCWALQRNHYVRDGAGSSSVLHAVQRRVPSSADAAADTQGLVDDARSRDAAVVSR